MVDRTDTILQDIERRKVLPSGVNSSDAAGAVVCVLTQRLMGGEAKKAFQALPKNFRGMILPCARHEEHPETFGRDEFLSRVGEHLNVGLDEAEIISRAVFASVRKQLPEEEIRDILLQLPHEVAILWRSAGELPEP